MKKILTMLALVAATFGAQAAYNFTLTIQDLSESFDHMSGDSAIYLIDRANGGQVLAYATMTSFDDTGSSSSGLLHPLNDFTNSGAPADGVFVADGVIGYDVHTISKGSYVQATSLGNGKKNVEFQLQFTSTALDGKYDNWEPTLNGGVGLEAVLAGEVLDASGNVLKKDYYQSVEIKTYTYNTGTDAIFSAAAKGLNVPEPTSAMLFLLGMAGLALKRKHA